MATKAATATTAPRKPEKALVFTWEGTDRKGNRVKGESRAATIALARADMRRQGITPIKVRKKSSSIFSNRKQKITTKDIAIFARQLATMMAAGIPLVQALDIVGGGHDNPSMQDLILSIKNDIESGTALTDSLAKHPRYFDELFCNLVAAGEAGRAGAAYDGAPLDLLPFRDRDAGHVPVEAHEAVAMVDDDRVAVDTEVARQDDGAAVRSLYLRYGF